MIGLWLKKSASMLIVTLLCFSVFAGGANENQTAKVADDNVVTLTFWDINATDVRTPIYEELIRRFEEIHPDIKIEYVGLPWSSAYEKMQLAVSTGTLPDCFGLVQNWLAGFEDQGALMDLDPYLESWDGFAELSPTVVESIRNTSSDGHIYEIPVTYTMDMFWVRPDVFAEKGIEINSWDDYFSAAAELTDKENGRYGVSIRGGAGGYQQILSMMYAYSGITDFFDENGNCTINDPKNVEFMERYASMYNVYSPESDINNGYTEMVAAFDSGVAMMILHNMGSSTEHAQKMQPGTFEAMLMPASIEGYRVLKSGDLDGFACSSYTEHPDEAFEFISFITSAESASYWNECLGQMPVNMVALEDDWVNEAQHVRIAREALADPNTKMIEWPTYLPLYSDVMVNIASPAWQEVLMGLLSVQDFMDLWAEGMTDAYKDYIS